MAKYFTETTICMCTHPYGDHLVKAPHRCTEDHATRTGHACSCSEFRVHVNSALSNDDDVSDRTSRAARSAASMTLERAISSVSSSGFGYGFDD